MPSQTAPSYPKRKQGIVGECNPCDACGKEMKKGTERFWIFVIDGGCNVVHPADVDRYPRDGGTMDWFPVGSECRKLYGEFALDKQKAGAPYSRKDGVL
jgi:hypothetical protein